MTVDFFGPLYGIDHVPVGDEDLLIYWSIPASRDIANFVWDTDVPEVTKPWPVMEPANLRDAMVMVIGSEDVTGHLYKLSELRDYYDSHCTICNTQGCTDTMCGLRGDEPTVCRECARSDCQDKWCGLRGDDDETMIIEGVVADAEG